MPSAPAIDERLQALLSIEQRLEARLREAETAAAGRISDARAQLDAARSATLASLEEPLAAEARVDHARHEEALAAVRRQQAETVARLEGLSGDELDRLARRVLDEVLGRGGDR